MVIYPIFHNSEIEVLKLKASSGFKSATSTLLLQREVNWQALYSFCTMKFNIELLIEGPFMDERPFCTVVNSNVIFTNIACWRKRKECQY
mgnify:CR=1 FL=1